ncbi:hypothetical protein MSG28_011407 [Choristoneura fumiferana]|uniref:Uncharacterized protein n=1 Tax=Choristoneura fumiferana TaxID=7141 RepID=A0ACC0JNB7_CHOFU|nr:hypothetical protein MSG28_011407 [Choristoneura fumiferana]
MKDALMIIIDDDDEPTIEDKLVLSAAYPIFTSIWKVKTTSIFVSCVSTSPLSPSPVNLLASEPCDLKHSCLLNLGLGSGPAFDLILTPTSIIEVDIIINISKIIRHFQMTWRPYLESAPPLETGRDSKLAIRRLIEDLSSSIIEQQLVFKLLHPKDLLEHVVQLFLAEYALGI